MKVTVVRPGELGAAEWVQWRTMQRATPCLDNPFLSAEFAQTVGRFRQGTRVAVLTDGPRIVGFFPFERRAFGAGVPIASGLTDCQGVIHEPGLEWDPGELLRGCGLASWEFDHLVDGQKPFEPHQVLRSPSPIMDLGNGYDTYLTQLRASAPKFLRTTRYKERKLGRDVAELRFVYDLPDHHALRTLLTWKSAQYQRTGRTDRFARPWIVGLVEYLLATRGKDFAGILSMLYAGDEPVAGHFGLRTDNVLAGWFPAYDTRYAKYSPGLILHLRMAAEAAEAGIGYIDMGKGTREYKEALKSRDLTVAEGRVLRPSMAAATYWASRAPLRAARNLVLTHPTLLRSADRALKQYGRLRTGLRSRDRFPRRTVT